MDAPCASAVTLGMIGITRSRAKTGKRASLGAKVASLPSFTSVPCLHNRTTHGLPILNFISPLSLIMILSSLLQRHLVRSCQNRHCPFSLRLVRIDTVDLSASVRQTTIPLTAPTWSLKPLSTLMQMLVSRAYRQSLTCPLKIESARRRRLRHSVQWRKTRRPII